MSQAEPNERLRRASSIAISVSAALSVPSAYIFGLTAIFPASVRTLIDYKLFANELLSFAVFLAGLSAVVRIQISYGQLVFRHLMSPRGNFEFPISPIRLRIRNWAGGILIVAAVPALMFVVLIVASSLYQPYFLLEWFGISIVLVTCSVSVIALATSEDDGIIHSFVQFSQKTRTNPSTTLGQPVAISLLVGIALLCSYVLGSTRMKSLASANDACIQLEETVVKGKILGETSSGIFVKLGELDLVPYFDFYARLGRFSNPRHQVTFVNRDRIVTIDPFCDEYLNKST